MEDSDKLKRRIAILERQLALMKRSAPRPHVTQNKGLNLVKRNLSGIKSVNELNALEMNIFDDGSDVGVTFRTENHIYKIVATKVL